MVQPPSPSQRGTQESVTIQSEPQCLHSSPKEIPNPPRTDDSRADFFAAYRKGYEEFDREYGKKYDEDLNTTLVFAGLFSAVSTTFVASVQTELQQDPNEMTAIYMQILIHTMNNTLFPDADPSSATWTGPPREIVIVQSLLYATLAISLLAAFLAMLGKQWVNRYLRNCDGSTAEKGRDRQRKLDGHEKWHFYVAIECLPMMLQVAVLLFGCALSVYLWTISRPVAWIILSFTLAGAIAYVFCTIAATAYYNCPYQTPPSIAIRTLARYLARYLEHSRSPFARLMRDRMGRLARVYSRSVRNLRWKLKRLRPRLHRTLWEIGWISDPLEGMDLIPLAAVGPPLYFEESRIDWEYHMVDARCISWMLNFTADSDVVFYGARLAADTVWHPKIADTLSPRVLVKPFIECLSHGRVIPGKLEHANVIAMGLAPILSIQLCMEPEKEDLQELTKEIHHYASCVPRSEPTSSPGVDILRIVSETPDQAWLRKWDISSHMPDDLPTERKLCLSMVILQTIWRWRQIPNAPAVFDLGAIDLFCKELMANGDHSHPTLKIHCLLIMAISLGHRVGGIDTLFVPNSDRALREAIDLFHQQILGSTREARNDDQHALTSVLSGLVHIGPIRVMGMGDMGAGDMSTGDMSFSWITAILDSRYPEDERYRMAGHVMQLLGKQLDFDGPGRISHLNDTWVDPLVRFLSLCEKFHATDSPPLSPHPESIALRILSISPGSAHFDATILPTLTSTLYPAHPLQSRGLTLKIFHMFGSRWFSTQMETVSDEDIEKLLQAVGDPFQLTSDPPPQDGNPAGTADHDPMIATAVLIEFASSNRWKQHLRHSNFASCEEVLSTEEGRDALKRVLDMVADGWLRVPRELAKITTAIERLRELQCSNTVEAVITWTQDRGIGSPEDREAWRLRQPEV